MTISFNGGADPEEVKFNGQDMETVIFNGVTVWEKVVGDEYTVTSATPLFAFTEVGYFNSLGGSISPTPSDPFAAFYVETVTDKLTLWYASQSVYPVSVKYDGVIYPLAPFVTLPNFTGYWSFNPCSNSQPLCDSILIIGNNTTFELIYP